MRSLSNVILRPFLIWSRPSRVEGSPPRWVNFSERFTMIIKSWPVFARANSARAGSDCLTRDRADTAEGRAEVFILRKVVSARRVILPSQKGDRVGGSTVLAEKTFCFSCKRLPWRFVRKCMKSWLAQGSEYFLNLFLHESAFRPEKPIVVSVRSSQKKMRHERNCKALLRLKLAAILNHLTNEWFFKIYS